MSNLRRNCPRVKDTTEISCRSDFSSLDSYPTKLLRLVSVGWASFSEGKKDVGEIFTKASPVVEDILHIRNSYVVSPIVSSFLVYRQFYFQTDKVPPE